METRANYATIGLFTLGVIVACFVFVYWLARYDESGIRKPMRILIPGSVTGLAPGSQVLFNGIKVGEVRTLRINPEDPNEVEAMVGVDPTQPIKADTKATLGIQGLTGIAFIELKGGSGKLPNLLDQPGIPTLEAQGSGLQDLIASAQELVSKVNTAVDRVNGFIDTAEPSLTTSIKNVQTFTDALAENSAGVKEFMSHFGDLSKRLGSLSETLSGAVQKADKIIAAIDPSKVAETIANIDKVTQKLSASSDAFPEIVANVKNISEQLGDTLAGAKQIIAAIQVEAVKSTINDIATVARRVQTATVDVNKIVADAGQTVADAKDFVASVKAKQSDIDLIVDNTRDMIQKLNAASTRIDGILGKVQDLVTDPNGKNFFAEATAAAAAIRKVAEAFSGRAGQIADNLANFSGQGLRNVDGLVDQLRRTTTQFDRTLNSIQSNPQRFIFGNPTVQDYNRK
ncbi:ABC transporter substrate-binding protein [Kaistia sp. 32K]|uniref:MlaD family protein n=1 Tax=Kaistia sp. 32K TaxID=2795690 RepID=UPI0019156720|nr:MlaD family protein [Kaistia sp. 32K]BCP53129.1 ABC transporter substrate-binding protein [Kaistia sp. 32K]